MMRCLPAAAILVAFVAGSTFAQKPPFVVCCGQGRASTGDFAAALLPDAPFNARRGYGFIGGIAGRLGVGAVRGSPEGSPITWRQGELKYSFRMPRGRYVVTLAMVETEVARAGLRVFDVLAEDEPALRSVDICGAVGDFAWLERSFVVGVYDGWLDIHLVSLTGDRQPRLSRITVWPRVETEGPPPVPSTPTLRVHGLPLRNELTWSISSARSGDTAKTTQAIVGYGVFRSTDPAGPFDSLTDSPVFGQSFVDRRVQSGVTYYYKVRTYGIEGGQSPMSGAEKLTAKSLAFQGVKTYNFAVPRESLTRMSAIREKGEFAPVELVFHDQRYPATLRYDSAPGRWQGRKSLEVDMSMDRYRMFRKRAVLDLSAEPGDFSQLREKLSSDAAAALGLPAPLVEPVIVLFNDRHVGMRFDVEDLDSKFRKRARLDRVGLMIRLTDTDDWRSDWLPRGVRIGKNGDVSALNRLVQEIHRLHPGEIEDFFTNYFYIDRFIERLAFAAARGELNPSLDAMVMVRDSRNGRWEFFRQHHRSGDWGIVDWSTDIRLPTGFELQHVLFPLAERVGRSKRVRRLALLTRFFNTERYHDAYLDRLQGMLEKGLGPEAFDAIVDGAYAKVESAVLGESGLWPFDDGVSFRGAPGKIKEGHRRRIEALLGAIRAERARFVEPLQIDRFLIDPADGAPWIQLRNRAEEPVDLSKYRISESFDRAGRVIANRTTVGPGKTFRAELGSSRDVASRKAGGNLVLWRQASPGRFVIADFVFIGHQTKGLAYGRDDGVASGWRFFRGNEGESGAGAPANVVSALAPPTPYYRSSVDRKRGGDLGILFQARGRREDGPGKIARVELRYREQGAASFQTVPMIWDESRFEYALTLEANESRPRTSYYFMAKSESGVERAYPLGAPGITYTLPVLPKIRINELCPRPGNTPNAPGEFIEIHNTSDVPVSIRGYHLSDDRRRPTKWRITEDIVIKPQGYVVFLADGLNRGRHTSFKLSNSGEFIGLYGRSEEGTLKIDSVAFRGVPLGHSWGRRQDGTRSFRAWKDPTPGKRNLPKIPEGFLEKQRAKRQAEDEARARAQEEKSDDGE